MKLFIPKPLKRQIVFVAICALWIGVFFISPDFIDTPFVGFMGFFLVFSHWTLLVICTFFLLYILAINKYIFAVSLPLIYTLGATLAYFRYAYKTSLTPMIVDAAIHNDLGTSLDLISLPLLIFVILNVGISYLFIRYRFQQNRPDYPVVQVLLAIACLLSFFMPSPRLHDSLMQRFPFSIYHNLDEYNKLRMATNSHRINPDPHLKAEIADSTTVVLVIGESLRADHLQLNGYHRATNPLLSKQKNVFSLPNIYTEYTYTNRSIPHILTRSDRFNSNLAFTETSFISLFQQCGYFSAWISNQEAAQTYVSFMKECDTIVYAHPEKSVYNFNTWLDEDLLAHVSNILLKNHKNNLIVLHCIGSHWYYNSHVSKTHEVFKPITQSKIIANCTAEQIINSYDNTVVYADFFLNNLICMLENRNAVLIYLSDHGETLGEDGQWLHASNHNANKNPACMVWLSDIYAQKTGKNEALIANKLKPYHTDFLFHSILDAGEIPSKLIDHNQNIFAPAL